jgi:protein involved in polysaccharide export with SLBB domain
METFQLPQAVGFPIQVRLDGTISLPRIDTLRVEGMTLPEVEAAIRRVYIEKQILAQIKGVVTARILVSLARPRTYHILVLREDSPAPTSQGAVVSSPQAYGAPEFISIARKGTGWELNLPAYNNDVMTAIAKSGGLPGTDALDEVIVQRNAKRNGSWEGIIQDFNSHGVPYPIPGTPIYRIPLRVRPGNLAPLRPEDIVLHDGDVLYIPAREERLFYTAGLIAPGQHIMPRDTDLDVLEALARVRAPFFNGNFAATNFNGVNTQPGLGMPSPTLLTVVRKLPHGGQIPIRVDVGKAIRNPRERILVQPGDILVLQETPEQGIVRYVTQMVNLNWINKYWQTPFGLGTMSFSLPGGSAPATIAPVGVGVAAVTPSAASSVAPIGIGVTTPVNPLAGR